MPEKPSTQTSAVRIPDGVTSPSYILHNAARLYGNKVALVDASSGRKLLYSNLVSGVRRLASALHKRGFKAEPNDGDTGDSPQPRRPVVCVYSPNSIEIPLIVHAVLVLGGTISLADPDLTTDDLFHQFQVLRPDYIVADRDKIDDAKFAASRIGHVKEIFVLGTHLRGHVSIAEMLADDGRSVPGDIKINSKEDVNIVTFVNDAKGEPKGVMHSQHSFNANVAILCSRNISPVMLNDVMMCCHPMWSMMGLVFYCGLAVKEGATMIILPSYKPENILAAMVQNKVTVAHTNTHMAEFLSRNSEVVHADLTCLRRVYNSGSPVREGVIGEVMIRTGVTEFREGFGTDEACVICAIPKGDTLPGYAGKACPSTELKFMDIIFGGVVEPDTYGEICVRGPQVMRGYLHHENTGHLAVDKEGWLHTGYLGCRDNLGLVNLYGKVEDLIECDQNFISPIELERAIRQHPAVEDVAVVGVPHRDLGHVPRAYVERKAIADIIEGDIYDHVAENLHKDKKLRGGVLFICTLPRSTYGDLLRHNLRAEAGRSFLDDIGEDFELGESFSNLDETDGEIYARKQKVSQDRRTSGNDDNTPNDPSWQEGKFREEDFADFGADFLHFSALDTTTPELDAPIITFVEGLDGFITTRDRDDDFVENAGRRHEAMEIFDYDEEFGTDGNNNTSTGPLNDILEEDEEKEEKEVETLKEKRTETKEDLKPNVRKVFTVDEKTGNREEQGENMKNKEALGTKNMKEIPMNAGRKPVPSIAKNNEKAAIKFDEQFVAEGIEVNSPDVSIVLPPDSPVKKGDGNDSSIRDFSITNPGVQELLNDIVNNYQPPLRTSTPVPESEGIIPEVDVTGPVRVEEITKIDRSTNPAEETADEFTLSEIFDQHSSQFIDERTEDYLPEESVKLMPPPPIMQHARGRIFSRRRPMQRYEVKPEMKLVRDPESGALVVKKVIETEPDVSRPTRHRYNTRQNVKVIDKVLSPKLKAKVDAAPTWVSTNKYGRYVSSRNLNVVPKHENNLPSLLENKDKSGMRHAQSSPDLTAKKKDDEAAEDLNSSDKNDGTKPVTSNLGDFRPEISRSIHDIGGHGAGVEAGEIGGQSISSEKSPSVEESPSPNSADRKKSRVKRFFQRFISQEKD